MRVKEMRELSNEELLTKVAELRKNIVQMRFELAGRKLRNTSALAVARKTLAQFMTIKTERELGLKRI